MSSRVTKHRSTANHDVSGQLFLVFLLGFAFFQSIITEMNAWETIKKIAEIMIRAIPDIAAMESYEKPYASLSESFENRTESFGSALLPLNERKIVFAVTEIARESNRLLCSNNTRVRYMRGPPHFS